MSHNFNFWGLMIATGMAFAVMIFGMIFLYLKATKSKSGDK